MWTLECATAAGADDGAALDTLNDHVGRQVWTHVDANDAASDGGVTTATTTTTTTTARATGGDDGGRRKR